MSDAFPYPFDATRQGRVDANGDLTLTLVPNWDVQYLVTQVSTEMPDAPSGATMVLRKSGTLVAPAFSAKRAALAGDPPIFLRPGERLEAVWSDCTPGDVGTALFIYEKVGFS